MINWEEEGIDSQDAQAALWHLQQQWPREMERMLKNRTLEQYLTDISRTAAETRALLYREANKGRLLPPDEVEKVMIEEYVTQVLSPQNPKYPDMDLDELELSEEAQELLNKFNREVMEGE